MTSEQLSYRIRRNALDMAQLGKSSHIGSVLSMADLLGVLYAEVLHVDPKNPKLPERDRFILSKGHAGSGVYVALAERGFFPKEKLKTHYQNGSELSGHVSHKGIAGVELSTGSLGHGLSVGAGMALAARKQKQSHGVFVLMSDGECDEGSNWEAILFAAHHKLANLVAIIDCNKIQSIKSTTETLNLEPFADKWRAFGWDVQEVDGHDHAALRSAFAQAVAQRSGDKPHCIIGHTTKGKGVSFMEKSVLWHYRSPQGDEYANAVSELEGGKL